MVLLLAAVIFLPYALYVEGVPEDVPALSLVALVYLGLLPTGVAQIILVNVIRDAGPVFLSLVNYQVPIWSVAFGAFLLAEDLPASLIFALCLILGGLGISQFAARRR